MGRRLTSKLSFNQRATLGLGVVSLIVAIAGLITAIVAAKNAADTTQLQNAVERLADLAQQAHRQVSATRREVKALQEQASATSKLVEPAQRSASAAVSGVRQQAQDFAIDQRPLVGEDFSQPGFDHNPRYDPTLRMFMWSYGYKNLGKGLAFDVSVEERLSVYGRPSFVTYRKSSELLPSEPRWSTALYPLRDADNAPAATNPKYVLSVNIRYKDGSGRPYTKFICRQRLASGADGNCTKGISRALGTDRRGYEAISRADEEARNVR